MACSIHRRTFCKDTVVSAAGIMLGGNRISSSHPGGSAVSTYAVMQEVMKYRKLDAHAHVGFSPGDAEKQLDIADRVRRRYVGNQQPERHILQKRAVIE